MSDERSTAGRVPESGIRALFHRDARWQAWLDVEAALAQAQADLGDPQQLLLHDGGLGEMV